MKSLKKLEGLPPWFRRWIFSWMASAATCATTGLPTTKGTTRLPSEMAIQIMRQHIRTRNFHPINSQTEKARLFAKQAVLRGQASLSEGNLFP